MEGPLEPGFPVGVKALCSLRVAVTRDASQSYDAFRNKPPELCQAPPTGTIHPYEIEVNLDNGADLELTRIDVYTDGNPPLSFEIAGVITENNGILDTLRGMTLRPVWRNIICHSLVRT